MSLRKQKRHATQAAIEDHATRLVAEHGFDAVTVEQICAAAGISRRTFFNYVDSKETAVLGRPPQPLSEETIAEFTAAPHDNLLAAMVELAYSQLAAQIDTSNPALARRRRCIHAQHPNLAARHIIGFHESKSSLIDAATAYLTAHPTARALDGCLRDEAVALAGLAAVTLQIGFHNWHNSDEGELHEYVTNALETVRIVAHRNTHDTPAN